MTRAPGVKCASSPCDCLAAKCSADAGDPGKCASSPCDCLAAKCSADAGDPGKCASSPCDCLAAKCSADAGEAGKCASSHSRHKAVLACVPVPKASPGSSATTTASG